MTMRLALFCAAIVGASVSGGLLPLAARLTHTRLQVYLSFAAGAMLGTAFFHMLPEAVDLGSSSSLRWAAAGLLGVFFLERVFSFHHHEAPEDPLDPCPTHPHEHTTKEGHAAGLVGGEAPGASGSKGTSLHWGLAAFGLAVHTLAGGVALASAVGSDSEGTAWGVFLATLVHKPADAMTLVSLMLRAGVPAARAHLANLVFSLFIPIGAGLFVLGTKLIEPGRPGPMTAATLAFSAGTFLCIALSDLLPELQFHEHDRFSLSAALLGGFALMAAAGMWA